MNCAICEEQINLLEHRFCDDNPANLTRIEKIYTMPFYKVSEDNTKVLEGCCSKKCSDIGHEK